MSEEARWDGKSKIFDKSNEELEPSAPVEVSADLWHLFKLRDTPELEPGQLWRLQWLTHAAIAVIDLRPEPGQLSALPVSEDYSFATDSDLILEPSENPLNMSVMVQVSQEIVVNRRVLDRCFGQIDSVAWEDLRRLRNSFIHSESSGLAVGRVGPQVTHELDERITYRVDQRELHAGFVFAEWNDVSDDSSSIEMVANLITQYTGEKGNSLSTLSDATGISVQLLMSITWGEAPDLNHKQLVGLAQVLGIDEQRLTGGLKERFPDELVELLDMPSERGAVARWSEIWEVDEIETRRKIARQLVGGRHRAKRMSIIEWKRLLVERFPGE